MQGILFIEPLYHAIVAGKKTMTRREGSLSVVNDRPDDWEETGSMYDENGNLMDVDFNDWKLSLRNITRTPRYHVGEVVYLKEPIKQVNLQDGSDFVYKYDQPDKTRQAIQWSNKLFMPADAARAFIRITSIKVERLLDITDEDCIAEGIEKDNAYGQDGNWKNYLYPQEGNFVQSTDNAAGVEFKINKKKPTYRLTSAAKTPKESFISLFRFANKISQKTEIKNIWVWCYSFEYLPNHKI